MHFILKVKVISLVIFISRMTTSEDGKAEGKKYEIVFTLGFDIHHLDADTVSLFDHFSLLSWLSLEYKIRISSYRNTPEGIPYYVAKARKNKYELNRVIEIYLFEYQKDPNSGVIVYYIQNSQTPLEQKHPIIVRFQKHPKGLTISIDDQTGYF